jgi:hypothetical protein
MESSAAIPNRCIWCLPEAPAEKSDISRVPECVGIVFWHRAGHSLEEIGQRIGLFGGPGAPGVRLRLPLAALPSGSTSAAFQRCVEQP